MQQKDTKHLGFFLNIFYANKGEIAATAMTHRAIYLPSPRLLSADELAEYREQASSIAAPDQNDGNEIQPGLTPEHLFTVPQEDNDAEQLKGLADETLTGKSRLYLFVTMKYSDADLPHNEIRVSEFCGWFSGTFDMWHNCGNRIYKQTLPGQPS
jgi:hypothetical protein